MRECQKNIPCFDQEFMTVYRRHAGTGSEKDHFQMSVNMGKGKQVVYRIGEESGVLLFDVIQHNNNLPADSL